MSDVMSKESFFKEYQAEKDELKKEYNDFNLLSAVLKRGDEVRLHSKFLATFLNPNQLHLRDNDIYRHKSLKGDKVILHRRNHYRGDIFLRHFLEIIGYKHWLDGYSYIKVTREKENVDIKITIKYKNSETNEYDNSKTKIIIIENKIWAKDQGKQIHRYIQKYNNDKDNILAVYLSPMSKEIPEEHKVEDSYISLKKSSEVKALYFRAYYQTHILKWLDECIKDCSEDKDANLKSAFETYKGIVLDICGLSRGKHVPVGFFFKSLEQYRMALSCQDKDKMMKIDLKQATAVKAMEFFSEIKEKLREELSKNYDEWEVYLENHDKNQYRGFFYGEKSGCPLRIQLKKDESLRQVVFGFQYDENYYKQPKFGVLINAEKDKEEARKLKKEIQEIEEDLKFAKNNTSNYWLCHRYFYSNETDKSLNKVNKPLFTMDVNWYKDDVDTTKIIDFIMKIFKEKEKEIKSLNEKIKKEMIYLMHNH